MTNIKDMTIEQLKALKCDYYENILASEKSLQAINIELKRREEEAKGKPEE